MTGYCSADTDFCITQKDRGTDPDITVYQSGQYRGTLTLSNKAAKELARVLNHLTELSCD